MEIFSWIWSERLQRKIVKESNNYAALKDPSAAQVNIGPLWKRRLTLSDFRKWCSICAFMGVRSQPAVRDFWNVQTKALYCDEVFQTMSRNKFQFILANLHLVSKNLLVRDKADSSYDPIGQVRWLLDNLVSNFNHAWNTSSFLCMDECMVAYNGQYSSFKQYLPLKPITHGIKVWCLACSQSKYILNWEVYVEAANEVAKGLEVHECGTGAGVVSRLTKGWKNRNYTLVTDNYFTSPMLYEDLLKRGFYAVGTVRQGRVGYPSSLHLPKKGKRGSLQI
jgi:hypothetical protein